MKLLPILTALCLAAAPALAQAPAARPAPGPQAAIGRPAEAPLRLGLNKAHEVRLPAPVRDVIVANPEIADIVVKTPQLAYLIGRKAGSTDAIFLDADGRQVMRLDLHVDLDLGPMRTALQTLLPGSNVEVQAVNNSIFLTGTAPSPVAAENARLLAAKFAGDDANVVNMMTVPGGEQVVIRVKVAEMQRQVAKNLGLRLLASRGDVAVGSGTGSSAFDPTGIFGTVALGLAGRVFEQLDLFIDALEEDGLVKTLAEPNLTAVSGEAANFLAGGEFPVPVGRDEDDGTITLEFKRFGVSLNFTPVVLSSGRISLRIQTEVSALSSEGAIQTAGLVVPALSVRRVETNVEMASGNSLVLAGLLRNDATNTVSGLPWLKDMPVLGTLFRSTAFQRNETELVIVASPYIVRPTAPGEIALPTDGFAPPNDIDLFLLGRLHDAYRRPGQPAKLEGPFGYIMQ
ncbi:MAG TPA: type II and III secretion system protein family protein [Alphaproteobacteria bacterium]|nr:type II and III secretion system protein family protein [Alphaproteobacteria bacterium]